MKKSRSTSVCVGIAVVAAGAATACGHTDTNSAPTRVNVVFSGGHETDKRDKGRPVALIAAALGVTPEVFREAFSRVTPAPAGQEPDPEQVRKNKEALLGALSRYGVTNERLDEVSDYYRYRPGRGNLWKHKDAAAYATIEKGAITGFVVTDAGAGYTTPPTIAVPGYTVSGIKVEIKFGKELKSNGAVESITIEPAKK